MLMGLFLYLSREEIYIYIYICLCTTMIPLQICSYSVSCASTLSCFLHPVFIS